MTHEWLSKTKEGLRLSIQVSPNAKRSEIISGDGVVLRIKLQAQPVDGKANDALIQFIAKKLRLPRKQILITHGLSSKRKLIEIKLFGISLEETAKQLLSD